MRRERVKDVEERWRGTHHSLLFRFPQSGAFTLGILCPRPPGGTGDLAARTFARPVSGLGTGFLPVCSVARKVGLLERWQDPDG